MGKPILCPCGVPCAPIARVQERPLTQDRTCLRPAWETESLGLGDKQVLGASPENEGNEPQTGGARLQPAPNPVYS